MYQYLSPAPPQRSRRVARRKLLQTSRRPFGALTSVVVSGVARCVDVLRQRVAVNVALRHRPATAATAAAPTTGRGARRTRVTNRGGGVETDKRAASEQRCHEMGSI